MTHLTETIQLRHKLGDNLLVNQSETKSGETALYINTVVLKVSVAHLLFNKTLQIIQCYSFIFLQTVCFGDLSLSPLIRSIVPRSENAEWTHYWGFSSDGVDFLGYVPCPANFIRLCFS